MEKRFSSILHSICIDYLPRTMFWSPDGNSLISGSYSNTLQIFNKLNIGANPEKEVFASFEENQIFTYPSTVTNCSWYPLMNIEDDSSSCFACVMPFSPIRLIDSKTGRQRSIYRCQLNGDHPAPLTSVAFNGADLLAGSSKTLFQCHILQPNLLGRPVLTCPGSIMSVKPHPTSGCIALGISKGDIAFVDSRDMQVITSEKFHNQALDQILWFTPESNLLFTSARLEKEVIGIDIRMPNVPSLVLQTKRISSRPISLSADLNSGLLFVGNEGGPAQVFDINQEGKLIEQIGNGPTPIAIYNENKNVLIAASGRFEIIINDNDTESSDSTNLVEFGPKLESIQVYIPNP